MFKFPSFYINTLADLTYEKSKAQDPPKKEYCSFWIRNGECDYEQQGGSNLTTISAQPYQSLTRSNIGCKFKHEMPHDPAVLSKLCLRDIPKWYRDKHHVRSLRSGEWKSPRVENNIKSSTRGRSTGNAYVQPHRRQQFAERESGTASTINVSKDSSVPAGVVQPDLLTQDPLPGYPALNPGRSMTENPSPAGDPTPTTLPDTSQTDEAPDPQPSTDPKIEASAQSQPQVSAKPTAGSQQRQTRRHKSRKSIQAPVRPASPESKIAANFSKTPGNTSSVNPNKVPSSETKAGGLPRLDIPSSRIPNAGTKSTLATVKPTTGVDKDEKKEQPSSVGGSETEKDKGSDTAKSTAVQAGLKPGAETDVFGLGLFEN